ncbi:ABC transporter substrate-binding protein [Cocleimonas sp. KMM 6892]|uniref:ABC transporter substrate-binding protein n=1 Tax=unclassified Cocleimonas TaxID=2639732 RepID=UPI002DBCEAAD|nr:MULTISPECIES: ABC transporter substrate-binding protein [unclassified Cocleimonas]MEB8431489.1 ABC transporter substrate-binding protein [Cocleimonas sp. KMM 6892]MEC4713739.1 ABC transporter substrate-binding protein [Cocleimonas sp. KMM 6895]MEC4743070.1 ABC transporter substrate-binding protein [Cocleimonas sp. KMM 6896]
MNKHIATIVVTRALHQLIVLLCFSLLMMAKPAVSQESQELKLGHRCESISPVFASTGECYRLLNDIFEGLIRVGKYGEPEPGAAKRWRINALDKTIVFYLNPSKRWSDGSPVVANDFALAWQSVLKTSKNQNALYFALMNLAGAKEYSEGSSKVLKGIQVIDPYTLRLEFDTFDPLFYQRTLNAALFPVPSHFVKKHGDHWSNRTDIPFNGQYKPILNTFYHSSGHNHLDLKEIHLVKNTAHPESSQLKIPKIHYVYVSEKDEPQKDALRYYTDPKTALHISYVSAGNTKLISNFLESKNCSLIEQPSTAVYLLSINRDRVEPKLVEAIKNIVEPEEVFSRASRRVQGSPTRRLVPLPNLKAYSDLPLKNTNYELNKSQRHDKARKLLQEIDISPLSPKTLTLLVTSDNKSSHLARVLTPILIPFGIKLKLEQPTSSDSFDKMRVSENYDLSIFQWFVALPDPSGFFISMSQLPRIFQAEDKRHFDTLMREANNSKGTKRFEKFRDAEEFYLSKSSAIPIIRPSLKLMAHNDVCGLTPAQSLIFPSAWLSWCPKQSEIPN